MNTACMMTFEEDPTFVKTVRYKITGFSKNTCPFLPDFTQDKRFDSQIGIDYCKKKRIMQHVCYDVISKRSNSG